MKTTRLLPLALLGLLPGSGLAATVNLTGIDALGASSFNSAGLWDNAAAPSAGNDYFVGNATRLRTPADGSSHTFAGDSLTINNTTGYADGILYKGTGSAGTITVGNLIMDGGLISHGQGTGDVFNLDGGMTVASGGARLYAKQGTINLYSEISGSGTITNIIGDNSSSTQKLWIHSSTSTFTGNILNSGRIEFTDNAAMNFVIGASGVNNFIGNIAGTQQHIIFGGDFYLDLTGAGTTIGDSWDLVTTVSASTYYGSTFTVDGFTDNLDDTWTKTIDANSAYFFDEGTGSLSVIAIPEPSAALLGAFGLIALLRRRRF